MVLRYRLRFLVFSGQIPERIETEACLLYEAKQVTAHCSHCSLWQGWTSYLLHVLHSGQTAFQVEQHKQIYTFPAFFCAT